MPKYRGVHYPVDHKGIIKGKPTHVVDKDKTFGDPIAKEATGMDKRNCLRKDPDYSINY